MSTEREALVFCPDWSRDNPYQKQLYSGLTSLGVPCKGMQGRELTLDWLWENKATVKFLHFHWLFGIYDPKSTGLDSIKTRDFLIKVICARLMGYKIIWTVHNFVSHEPSHLKLETFLRKMMARLAHRVVVHCEYAKGLLHKSWRTPSHKIIVIPHGSYLDYYLNEISMKEARSQLGLEARDFIFLFFGMVRNYKGLRQLFSSYAEVQRVNPRAKLVIAGKPFNEAIKADIENFSRDHAVQSHLRFIPDEEVQLFFNAADAVVLPYQNILTSGAALLAFSFGKPLIVPGIGCIPELVNKTNGFTYNHDRELTETMLRALRHSDLSELGKNALDTARDLSWERLTNDLYLPMLTNL